MCQTLFIHSNNLTVHVISNIMIPFLPNLIHKYIVIEIQMLFVS